MFNKFKFLFVVLLILLQGFQLNDSNKTVSKFPRAVTYEIFVQAFSDSNGDGIGDFNGTTSKLDYLKDLGVNALWLMPIHPSQSEHKYDVMDYYGVHPDYGTMDDFKNLVKEAHKRNIKIILDLVINHSSRNHPWFQSAMNDLNSPYRNYYVWATDEEIQKIGAEKKATADSDNRWVWNKVEKGNQKFYAYFGGGMPDLNFDNPKVREEVFKIGKYWLNDIDVDGFRLDAAKHIYPDERAEDNHKWWIEFKKEMQKAKKDVYIVGEVWDKSEKIAPYFQGLSAVFNFDLGYAISRVTKEEKDDSLISSLVKTRNNYHKYSADYVDATFLTNHDQTRIMSVVGGNKNRAKTAAALLLTLPGSPYIYYGEEIGMLGEKPDRYIREPFIWGKGKENGQVTWLQPKHSSIETIQPVDVQEKDSNSVLNHYKKFLKLRNSNEVLTYGEISNVVSNDKRLIPFVRNYKNKSLFVIHNISNEAIKYSIPNEFKDFNKIYFSNGINKKVDLKNLELPAYSTLILSK